MFEADISEMVSEDVVFFGEKHDSLSTVMREIYAAIQLLDLGYRHLFLEMEEDLQPLVQDILALPFERSSLSRLALVPDKAQDYAAAKRRLDDLQRQNGHASDFRRAAADYAIGL